MGRCCGGKNAGKPISRYRWVIGQVIFLGYHLFVQCLMLSVAVVSPKMRQLSAFHRQYVLELWRQIRGHEGIKVLQGVEPESADAHDEAQGTVERPAA